MLRPRRAAAAAVLVSLVAAATAGAALRTLPIDGSQVNNDPPAGIDPSRDAGTSDVVGGSLAGGTEVPWAAFEQLTTGAQQVFVRAFKGGAWATQGNQGGSFPGSLNFEQAKDAEAPSIDFAGAGRAVPWASWYEVGNSVFGHEEIFASRFDATQNTWIFAGQDRGSGVPSLNINTAHDAENPSVAGGTRAAGNDPVPWVAWQEVDPTLNQIFVSKAIKAATCPAGTKPAPATTVIGGFCWQQVGVERLAGDPTLNIDPTRDGVEPDIAFTGPSDTVPWVVWYEQNPGANGITNELVFAAKASTDGTADGGDQWQAVGNGTTAPQPLDTGTNCRASATAERACALNKDPTVDGEDARVAAGTMTAGATTVPWVVWDETVGTVKQVFASRLVGGTHFELVNGGQPLSQATSDATRADITFSGTTPYVTWRQQIGAGDVRAFAGHLVNAASPTFVLDTPGGVKVSSAGLALDTRAPVSSGCTANPFNGDGASCQAGALGTPFFLFTDGATSSQKLFGRGYEPAGITTGAPNGGSSSGATLNGSVDPGGATVGVHFDFGPTTAYGSSTALQRLGPANGSTAFSAAVSGLSPLTTFHYRAVVQSDFGASFGADQTFTTTAALPTGGLGTLPKPTVKTEPLARVLGFHSRIKSSKLKSFRGTASDPDGIARVEIAVDGSKGGAQIARVKARCLLLKANGTLRKGSLSKSHRCAQRSFLRATGTTKWTYKLRRRLPAGTYVLFVRAVDKLGNKETHFTKTRGNRLAFTVLRG